MDSKKVSLLFFCGGEVGNEAATWIRDHYKDDITLAVVPSTDDPCYKILHGVVDLICFSDQVELLKYISDKSYEFDYGLGIWFGPIMSEALLNLPRNGFIGTHPAYLPFTRGANFNIWPLVEEVPYGVSLFKINAIANGIDTGDIVARKEIPYNWLDNGQTLREKGQKGVAELLIETYPKLRAGLIRPEPQDLSVGSTHYKKELEAASLIDLDKSYTARQLLNWLRARTYPGYPACHFIDDGQEYEVRISITKRP